MNEQSTACETIVGILRGRDAIFLDDFCYKRDKLEIILRGEINRDLCSQPPTNIATFIPYALTFLGVAAFSCIPIDLDTHNYTSSFDHVENSRWLKQFRSEDTQNNISPKHTHFTVTTYDDVFNIIAKSYTFEIQDPSTQS